jgi:hypothetical protein
MGVCCRFSLRIGKDDRSLYFWVGCLVDSEKFIYIRNESVNLGLAVVGWPLLIPPRPAGYLFYHPGRWPASSYATSPWYSSCSFRMRVA